MRYQGPCIGRGVERSLSTYVKGLGGAILGFMCKGELIPALLCRVVIGMVIRPIFINEI